VPCWQPTEQQQHQALQNEQQHIDATRPTPSECQVCSTACTLLLASKQATEALDWACKALHEADTCLPCLYHQEGCTYAKQGKCSLSTHGACMSVAMRISEECSTNFWVTFGGGTWVVGHSAACALNLCPVLELVLWHSDQAHTTHTACIRALHMYGSSTCIA
jgi:hypothetical protein